MADIDVLYFFFIIIIIYDINVKIYLFRFVVFSL